MATTEPQILDVEGIREDFPILQREFGGEQLVYLDNAATAQTPDQVIDAMSDYYRETNANVHRGLHHLSQEASIAYEDAHDRLAEYVGEEFEAGEVSLSVTPEFYEGETADEQRVVESLARCSVANLVGSRAVDLAIEHGFVDEENVLDFEGTRHAQLLWM